jgi:hypothetical protein
VVCLMRLRTLRYSPRAIFNDIHGLKTEEWMCKPLCTSITVKVINEVLNE